MRKDLDTMTNNELGHLFPVILTEPDPDWSLRFSEEEALIRNALGEDCIYRLGHIGSTAVPNLIAKPTIDILLEVTTDTQSDRLLTVFADLGYHFIPKPENPAPHMMFVKGYTPEGFRGQAFHVHIRYPGDWDEYYFRDYLRTNPGAAGEYVNLKLRLAEKFRNDRDGYTEAKSEFIQRIILLARKTNS